MDEEKPPIPWGRICLILILTALTLNLGIINYTVFFKKPEAVTNIQPQYITQTKFPDNLNKSSSIQTGLDSSQVSALIQEATSSLTLQVEQLQDAVKLTKPVVTNTTVSKNTVKELYIPLGSGSTSSKDWIDLSGVEVYITPENYGKIKEMYFEATLRIPSGNGTAYARLKNVTDSVSFFESEVSKDGSSGQLISSGKLPLYSVTKLFRVQLKSSLGAEVVLDNARIKIFVE